MNEKLKGLAKAWPLLATVKAAMTTKSAFRYVSL